MNQLALEEIDQGHPELTVHPTVVEPPAGGKSQFVVVSDPVHPPCTPAACVTVNICPPARIVPVRLVVPVFADTE